MENIKTIWKQLADNKNIASNDVAAYMIIRAIHAKSNDKIEVAKALLSRAFTPITNKNKLNNGCNPYDGLQRALHNAKRSRLTNELSALTLGVFTDIVNALRTENWKPERDDVFCYILTRSDIPPIHQLVQTAHATMVAGQKFTTVDAKKLHFCILNAGNERDLIATTDMLKNKGISYADFFEPDSAILWNGAEGGEYTSIACKPMRRSIAKRMQLFEGKELLSF